MAASPTSEQPDASTSRIRAETYAVLAEIGRIISSSADREEIYERFLDQVDKFIPSHELGGTAIDRSMTSKLVRELAELRREFRKSLITPRQVEILRLLGTGNSYDEMAKLLFVSGRTVQREMRNILDRLGVNNTASAISEAYKQHIL